MAVPQWIKDEEQLFLNSDTQNELCKKAIECAIDYFGEDRVEVTLNDQWRLDTYAISHLLGITSPTESHKESLRGLLTTMERRNSSKYAIIIYWPEATITNENDDSIVIKDFFVKVNLCSDGIIKNFVAKRTTFTQSQWAAGYMHSHCHTVGRQEFGRWTSMCVGSGPIVRTLEALNNTPSEDLYNMFFWELDKVIHVESLRGVPYISMSNVRAHTRRPVTNVSVQPSLQFPQEKALLSSYLKSDRMKIAQSQGNFRIGMSFLDFVIDISDYALSYRAAMNEWNFTVNDFTSYFANYLYVNGTFYIDESRGARLPDTTVGDCIITFKGRQFPFVIEQEQQEDMHGTSLHIFKLEYAAHMYYMLTAALNFAYVSEPQKHPIRSAYFQSSHSTLPGAIQTSPQGTDITSSTNIC